jgi:outer membrane protein TolC
MRWKVVVAGLALSFAAVVGCKQYCFMPECDYEHYRQIGLPSSLECSAEPISPEPAICKAPSTILDPAREPYYLTLREAIALALEHGTVGNQNLQFTPLAAVGGAQGVQNPALTYLDNEVTLAGRAVVGDDSIRAFALDPAITGAGIEGSLSKFDPILTSSLNWTTTDQPGNGAANALQAAALGAQVNAANAAQIAALNVPIQSQEGRFSTSLLKPLPTGGVAGITFTTDYLLSNFNGRFNPAYRPNLQFQFEQPLLQGFGVEINQLRTGHPNSILTPFLQTNYVGVEGILITRLRFDQQRAEFERLVHAMVTNVELAYWTLYGTYWNLYSREQALRQAYEAWRINKARYDAGKIAIQDFAQTRQQYELFRGQRLDALARVLEDERLLRGMLGLPVEDGRRLVPVDEPTTALFEPDWQTSINEALALRPELVLARQDLKFQQLNLINQKNLLLPDLRSTFTYDINAIGSHLSGGDNDPNNAFSNLADNKFNNWTAGLRLTYPLGYRDAHAAVRVARLNLARSYAVLEAQELKTQRFVALTYRRIFESYEIARALRAQREAAALQLEARFKEFLAGRGTLDVLLEAQRVWADALRDEYQAIATYNSNLAGFEFAKGTILQHDHVVIAEGPLPKCALVRAVDHEQERKKALVLRERNLPVKQPVVPCGEGNLLGLPDLPTASAPSLPALFAGQPDVSSMPYELPPMPGAKGSVSKTAPAAAFTLPDSAKPIPATMSGVVPAGATMPAGTVVIYEDSPAGVPIEASAGTITTERVVTEPVRRP